ncbi:APC family permease [Aneurinibacillus uraniidurans]|uniref:APC family permease n=1 Tax=Aneurinibacillus uraniidurans TaxID=2966586 RepID=UPI00234A228F|nr:APC family permease [Aneurinibacillus sp. B1]WCN37599.1 APC family permease [Aneurinibacillus sp. B1]
MEKSAGLKRSLGLWSIVMLGVGYMTPMVVFDTFGIVSNETNGHVPVAYVMALAAMLFTAFSYGKMVRAFPSAGSAYTYTQKTMNKHLGFMVGWAALLDYMLLPMVNALLSQIYLTALFPAVPSWIWIAAFAGLVTIVNMIGMSSTARFNNFLVVYQILTIVIFIGLAIWKLSEGMGYGSTFSLGPIYKPDMQISALIAGATVLCFSFLGFDAVTTYAEETADPVKTIPRAIFLTALIGGLIFTASSYFAQAVFPSVSNFKHPDATSPEIALYVGGQLFQLFFLAGALAGTIASGLASHASVSRLLYVMGRDGVLPKKLFGYVHPVLRTPVFNVLLVGLVTMTAMFFDLMTATSFISFGALIAFTFVNLSVIAHYSVGQKLCRTAKGFFSYMLAPLLGAATIAVLWWNLERNSFMLGLGWAVVGFAYLVYSTKFFTRTPGEIHFEEADDHHVPTELSKDEIVA